MKLSIEKWALDYSSKVRLPGVGRFPLFITGGPNVPVPDVELPYFYCSWAEIIADKAQKVSQETGVAIIGENKLWGTCFMDCGNPDWASYLIETVISPGIDAGYKGVFLDTFDGMEDAANALGYAKDSPERTRLYKGGSAFVWAIAFVADGKLGILTNRGFPQCQRIMECGPITDCSAWRGMMIESMWHSKSGPTPGKERKWLLGELAVLDGTDATIMTLDYCGEPPTAWDIVKKSSKRGYVPLVVQGSLTPPKLVAFPGKAT